MNFSVARRAMVDSQLRPEAVTDPLVIAAMASVPREEFVPAEVRELAYIDRPLDIGGGRALSPPASLGRLLSDLAPRPGERALVVGAATGYSAAVLARIGLSVLALEEESMERAESASSFERVTGPLAEGWPAGAPYDLILVDGLIEYLPDGLVQQLAPGGRLGTGLVEAGVSRLMIGRKGLQGFGLQSVADAPMAALPGFARPPVFSF